MATGIVSLGVLGDASYNRVLLTDTSVFTGTIYVTRIGPFVQISGVGIKLKNALAANDRVYSAGLIPLNYRANRDFPVNTFVNNKVINGGVYINASGTLFFVSGSAGFSTSDQFTISGTYIVYTYGATDSAHD